MRRYNYYRILEQLPTRVLVESIKRPSRMMTRTHVALHLIALRRRGAIYTVNYLEKNQ